jgi:hypothetical protein
MIRTTILLLTGALSLIMVANTTQAADPTDRFNPYTGEYNEPTQHTIVLHDHAKAVVHPAHKKEVSGEVKVKFVDNKADADATHIYFGPSNDRSVITSAEMKADYDANPKAYAQGWKDGWRWAAKQSDFSAEEDMERSLYGDIDNEPGETKALAFQAATFLLRDRGDAKTVADAKPAVEGSVNELDKAGEAPYQWTQRYIEQAVGVGVWSLISPNVTFGPYATIYNGQHCWMCKVTFHVQGDNRQHYAIVYEEPVMGAGHVVGCEIDF